MGRIILPYLNPIDLVEINPVVIPQYVSKFVDDYTWADRLRDVQKTIFPFYQLWENSDVITVQFQNSAGPVSIRLVNCEGKTVDAFLATPKQMNKFEVGMFVYEANISLAPYPQGRYVLIFEIGVPVKKALITNPILIKQRHADTILYQYKHKRYRGNMLFETGIEPSIRLKSYIFEKDPESKDTVYEDQVMDVTMLKSVPYEPFDLVIEQIPWWIARTFNWIMGCSSVRMDGKYFTKNGDDAKIESSVPAYYGALKNYNLEIRKAMARNSKIFDVPEDTNDEITITLNVDSKGFADTSLQASSSVVTFLDVE